MQLDYGSTQLENVDRQRVSTGKAGRHVQVMRGVGRAMSGWASTASMGEGRPIAGGEIKVAVCGRHSQLGISCGLGVASSHRRGRIKSEIDGV